jgi:hypothetical protein
LADLGRSVTATPDQKRTFVTRPRLNGRGATAYRFSADAIEESPLISKFLIESGTAILSTSVPCDIVKRTLGT